MHYKTGDKTIHICGNVFLCVRVKCVFAPFMFVTKVLSHGLKTADIWEYKIVHMLFCGIDTMRLELNPI